MTRLRSDLVRSMANNKSLSNLVAWLVIMFLVAPSTASMEETVKLRVGVPKKEGFPEFVNVIWDEDEHKYNVSGYCMDVFNAVLPFLPFKVSLQIEAYDVNESSNGTYDALVQQVPQKYDVVVGDITILANRSKFVDFTLPYTESGVQMVVAARQGREQSMWTFVKPFSWDLWLSIVVISMFIGSVILIMERNKQVANNSQQLSPIYFLWFPISQAVLPEREGVVKKCSRFVLMVWLLLAFVLMQSYTASLTTMMTVEQLQPSFLNVDDLRTGDYYVGYQTGSFVYDLLLQKWKFNPSKLRAYGSISEYHQALKIGSRGGGGGVSAIVDELPYLKLFLQKYGSNYMIAGPTYRTAGFGFAFARNSNLTAAFSRGILEVTESDEMDNIEAKYFGKIMNNGWQYQSDASTTTSSSSSPSSLTFYSFSGLFLITGIATLLALFVSETVIWRTPISMAKAYSHKYLFRTTSSTSAQTHPTTDDDSSSHTTESV